MANVMHELITQELKMEGKAIAEIRIWLVVSGIYLLMTASMLTSLFAAMTHPQPAENRIFGVFATGLFLSISLVVCWMSILFSLHVDRVIFSGDVIELQRMLAPRVTVQNDSDMKKFAFAIPCWGPPHFRRGFLFISGKAIFYVSDYLTGADSLIKRLSTENQRH
jgi:hypothetical protein